MGRVALVALILGSAIPAKAVLVQEVAITPYKQVYVSVTGFYTGPALAGINQLLVDGVAMNGFCIDPFHFALPSSSGYLYAPLASAPKAPGTMGDAKALLISKLWGMAYSPTMTASQAAAFQIALWEIVGGPNFTLIGFDYGASDLLNQVTTYNGPVAILTALTGPGQDYVVPDLSRTTGVPDGGATLGLLGFAVAGLAVVRVRLRKEVA